MQNSPVAGEKYQILQGNKAIVVVGWIDKDGAIRVTDSDGLHFVPSLLFGKYFKKVNP